MDETTVFPNIDGYEILRPLGAGGFGDVFAAKQKVVVRERTIERTVAIKLTKHAGADDPQFIGRFVQEAQLLFELAHENIIRVYNAGEVDNRPYIVMEYAAGGDLSSKARSGLDEAEIIRIVGQMAAGLSYLHKRGIIHRDIKPSNVFFDETGTAKIGDLGISKKLRPVTGDAILTVQGQLILSPAYSSPEQISGQPADARSDLYSTGIVLYELLTGSLPFAGPQGVDMMMSHIHSLPPPLQRHGGFQPIMDQLLAKNPDDRFQSADELIAALALLDATLGDAPTNVANASPESAAHASVGRIATIVLCAVVILLGGGALWWWQSSGNGSTNVAINVHPSDARMFDVATGQPVSKDSIGAPGSYRWALIAPGHVGRVVSHRIGTDGAAIDISLSPLAVPTAADYARYVYGGGDFSGNADQRHVLEVLSTLRNDAASNANAAAFNDLWFLAERGDTTAAIAVAEAFDRGWVQRKDSQRAVEFATIAAKSGHPLAEYQLARLYGADGNAALQRQFLTKAAAQGFAPAQFDLAVQADAAGLDTPHQSEMLRFLKAAANQSFPNAELWLAEYYLMEQNGGCAQLLGRRARGFAASIRSPVDDNLQPTDALAALITTDDIPASRCLD